MAATGCLCGVLYRMLPDAWDWPLLCTYCLWMVVKSSVGITTYLVPTEAFPAAIRTTACGIAAASGKAGALLGTALFPVCEAAYGLTVLLLASGSMSAFGSFCTVLF